MRIISENNTEQQCVDFFKNEMQRLLFFCTLNPKKIVAAVSGGSDSMCLLWFLQNWCSENSIELHCVTVDHKLREESGEEAKFVRDVCREMNVKHTTLEWLHGKITDHGKLENLAREARYNLISDYCNQNDIPIICVAHNWDDQIETHLLRNEFKSTETGLAGMSQIRSFGTAKILRPVLHFTKEGMRNILRRHNIPWKNDPMNDDEKFKRVAIRKKLQNMSHEMKGEITEKIFALRNARNKIETESVKYLADILSDFGYAKISDEVLKCSAKIQKEIFRRIVGVISGKKYWPVITDDFLNEIATKRRFSKFCLVVHKKNDLFFFRENRNLKPISADGNDDRFIIEPNAAKLARDLFQHHALKEFSKNNFLFTNDDVSFERIPREAAVTLPYIIVDGKKIFLGSGVRFIKRADFLDVFV